jgi:hypothetical protein
VGVSSWNSKRGVAVVWRLYDLNDSELERNESHFLDLPRDATPAELLAATVDHGWHSFDDSRAADLWHAVVVEGQVNTFVLRWETADELPNAQIQRLLSNLEILLKVNLREEERWEQSLNNLKSAIKESLDEPRS